MLDSKFILTLVGLIISVFAISKTDFLKPLSESFINVGRTIRVAREVVPDNGSGSYSVQNNYKSIISDVNTTVGHNKFVSYPNFQADLSPRGASVGYGSSITYNMPSYKNQAVPKNPLTFSNMASSKYKDHDCGKGCEGYSCKNNIGGDDPKYVEAMNKIYDGQNPTSTSTEHIVSNGLMAVADMNTIEPDGSEQKQVIYDRYIFANQNSRLRSRGDPIRGDLPIVPNNTGWFNVNVNPSIDLMTGAINVIAGNDNETSVKLGQLKFAASGGYSNIVGGEPLSKNMSNQYSMSLSGQNNDISVTAFP